MRPRQHTAPTMASVETRTIEPDEAGMRLDRWFKEHYPDLSFGHLQKLLRSGQVRVDGGRVKTSTRLEPGQAVRVPPLAAGSPSPAPTGERRTATRSGARASRATTPNTCAPSCSTRTIRCSSSTSRRPRRAGRLGADPTHVDAMLEALRDRKGQKPRLVHRLDRDTSGVLVVARTRLAASKLAAGLPRPRRARSTGRWSRACRSRARAASRPGSPRRAGRRARACGSPATATTTPATRCSLYSVVDNAGQNLAWLTMRPVTGRTHQLRAHAAHIGHPIIGDPKYFKADANW